MPQRIKVNLTIDKDCLAEARALGINMSRVADDAIAKAVKAERWRIWQEEHRGAFEAYNERIEREGVPLAEYRKF